MTDYKLYYDRNPKNNDLPIKKGKQIMDTYVWPSSWAATQFVIMNESARTRHASGLHIAPILLSPLIPDGGLVSV